MGEHYRIRALNAQYIDASAHCEVIFKSKHARKSHIQVTELVNLSIPNIMLLVNASLGNTPRRDVVTVTRRRISIIYLTQRRTTPLHHQNH